MLEACLRHDAQSRDPGAMIGGRARRQRALTSCVRARQLQNGISSSTGLSKFLLPEDPPPRFAPPLPLDGDGA